MFLTPAIPRSNNENTNVIAKKTPVQAAARRAFGDIPVNVKKTSSPAFSKSHVQHKFHQKPTPVKAEPVPVPRCQMPQFYIRPDDEDLIDCNDFPAINKSKDDYSDIRPVGEMEKNIKNLMYRTPPPTPVNAWGEKLDLFLEQPGSYFEDGLSQSPPKKSFMEISLPEMDVSL